MGIVTGFEVDVADRVSFFCGERGGGPFQIADGQDFGVGLLPRIGGIGGGVQGGKEGEPQEGGKAELRFEVHDGGS